MIDLQIIVVFVIGLSLGSGIAFTRSGPYFFFYLTLPILSAIALTLMFGQLSIPGFDFQFDRFLPMVIQSRMDLIIIGFKGFAAGSILQWLARRLFTPDRRKNRELAILDASTPMDRRKYLAVLGLPKNAGPRDIMLAWTKLSGDLQSPNWSARPKRRKTDLSQEDYKRQIDEAYHWLKANPQKDGMLRPVKRGLRRAS